MWRKSQLVKCSLCRWDTRLGDGKPFISRKAHNGQVYSVDFNKKTEFLLLSGGEDGDANLWDIRNMSKKVMMLLYSFTLSSVITMLSMLSVGVLTVQFNSPLALLIEKWLFGIWKNSMTTLPKSKETKYWYVLYYQVYSRWSSFESDWLELV